MALLAASGSAAIAGTSSGGEARCELPRHTPERVVVEIIDGETLLLDDATKVRLIGALAPSAFDIPTATGFAPSTDWPPAQEAQAALKRLAKGRNVKLAFAKRRTDRYGRLLAHVFVEDKNGSTWLQGAMLSYGQARAYGIPESYDCIDGLKAAEASARTTRQGLWASPAYQVHSARRNYELLRLRNTYQLVDGTVIKAQRTRSGRIYLNFGTNWRTDFSASIPTSLSRAQPAWAASLLDLQGKRVRIRGWITRRNGPMIEIEDPSQIEQQVSSDGPLQSAPQQ
ncbi:MAG: thermonuclease family protein [Hyphomicrobiaceae bacterium]|nr:thermonuclease family protein [Hyphomicrobiaceae bacterium]